MLICLEEGCSCCHRQLLNYMEQGLNNEAALLLSQLDYLRDAADSSGKTLLHYAVEYGNPIIAEYLIGKGCDVNAQNSSGDTALMLAVKCADMQIAQILFANDADFFIANREGKCPLEVLFYKSLNEMEPLSTRPQYRFSILLGRFFQKINEEFATEENYRIKRLLLDANSTIKLIFAVRGHVDMMEFMLQNDSKIDDFFDSRTNWSAVRYAIAFQRLRNVKSLIRHGSNLRMTPDNQVWSPLSIYCTYKFDAVDEEFEVLKALLRDLQESNEDSETPETQNRLNISALEHLLSHGNKGAVRTLLQSDVDTTQCYKGRSHSFALFANDNLEVNDIFDLGVTLDPIKSDSLKDSTKEWLWDAARVAISASKFDFLLKYGVIDHRHPVVNATLHDLTSRAADYYEVTQVLLQYGADAQMSYDCDITLLDYLLKNYPEARSTKIMIAHLAMLEAIDQSTVTKSIRICLDAFPAAKKYFDTCLQLVEELKSAVFYGNITLFELLIEKEHKLTIYARMQPFAAAFGKAMNNQQHLDSYYINFLQRRIEKAVDRAKKEREAIVIIEVLTGSNLCSARYSAIMYKIINYLNLKDLEIFCPLKDTVCSKIVKRQIATRDDQSSAAKRRLQEEEASSARSYERESKNNGDCRIS